MHVSMYICIRLCMHMLLATPCTCYIIHMDRFMHVHHIFVLVAVYVQFEPLIISIFAMYQCIMAVGPHVLLQAQPGHAQTTVH